MKGHMPIIDKMLKFCQPKTYYEAQCSLYANPLSCSPWL